MGKMTDNQFTEAEKQLLIVMGHFKGTFPDEKKLLKFGEENIGEYLVRWDDAYTMLMEKGLLQKKGTGYFLTERGESERITVEVDNPLWLYEYNMYFTRAETSEAHRIFCERVYGKNLCQHGITDMNQLHQLIEVLHLSQSDTVLDLGCGCGLITEWLSDATGASFTGIDLSGEAIKQAKKRERKDLHFQIGNMNHLEFDENSFDAIISIDTFYFVDLNDIVVQLKEIVNPHGQMGIFFTQWIDDDTEKELLFPKCTELAAALNNNHLQYTTQDFTREEEEHWHKKVEVLEELKPLFEKEGNLKLFEYRYDEAVYYKGWDPEKRSRYLYHITM